MASLRWFFPRNWESVVANFAARKVDSAAASKWAQRRNVIRMDLASRLDRRAWYKANGPTYRYLAYDASPQRGHEYFVTVERVVRRCDVDVASGTTMPPIESRLLPLCVLGCGRMGLAEKAQAHIHQVWLDYGPAISDVRAANLDVRQCLSDMGTELGIADARDVVGECIGQRVEGVGSCSHLYPLALTVPGPQHIIDTSLQRGLQALPWWPEWQRSAKATCQFLRGNRLALLQERVRSWGGQPDLIICPIWENKLLSLGQRSNLVFRVPCCTWIGQRAGSSEIGQRLNRVCDAFGHH